jgi:hypothetical protein
MWNQTNSSFTQDHYFSRKMMVQVEKWVYFHVKHHRKPGKKVFFFFFWERINLDMDDFLNKELNRDLVFPNINWQYWLKLTSQFYHKILPIKHLQIKPKRWISVNWFFYYYQKPPFKMITKRDCDRLFMAQPDIKFRYMRIWWDTKSIFFSRSEVKSKYIWVWWYTRPIIISKLS